MIKFDHIFQSDQIFCFQMGLGKTVEVLACVLLNPRKDYPKRTMERLPETLDPDVKDVLEAIVSKVAGQVEAGRVIDICTSSPRKRRVPLNQDEASEAKKGKKVTNKNRLEVEAADYLAKKGGDKKKIIEPEIRLECYCGATNNLDAVGGQRIQCQKCGSYQHKACVNWQDRFPKDEYMCPHCRVMSDPVPSGATLIISPNSICHQWYEEIQKHLRTYALKVHVCFIQ